MASVQELLKRMDNIEWDKVPNYHHRMTKDHIEEKQRRFSDYLNLLRANGIMFSGPLLDLCCGPVSFASVYPDTVGLDIEWSVVKELRKRGVRAIQGDIREMRFDDGSFDSVICFYPPINELKKTLPNLAFGAEALEFDEFYMAGHPAAKTWQQRFIQYTLPIARRHIVLHDTSKENPNFNSYFLGFYKFSKQKLIPLENTRRRQYICILDK
jgi:hypothetical protein